VIRSLASRYVVPGGKRLALICGAAPSPEVSFDFSFETHAVISRRHSARPGAS
jgi:hypothetical protein